MQTATGNTGPSPDLHTGFSELPTDLMALCGKCHTDIHHKTPANDNQLKFDFDDDDD
jgi:hypothetical protein